MSAKASPIMRLLASILWLAILSVLSISRDTAIAQTGQIVIGKPEIGQLFASQYRYYQSRRAGQVSIQNHTADLLYAEVSVTVSEYAPTPITTTTPVPVGKTTQVPLRIDFHLDTLPRWQNPQMLDAEIDIRVYSEDEASAEKQMRSHKRVLSQFQLYDLQSLPDNPPEAIAVFIDAGDAALSAFSQSVRDEAGSDSAQTAQRLFVRMQEANILCIEQSNERVQYPRELLKTTIGSHSDCALLYAALLENADIPVALMVVDNYILVLLQAGTGQQTEAVSWQDKRWIPIDIRNLKDGFSEARMAGLRTYETLKNSNNVQPFILREAWETYKPVRFVSPELVKQMTEGITHARREAYDEAEQMFKAHLDGETSAAAYNNLGNIALMKAQFAEAEGYYLKALKADPGDGGIFLNLGMMHFANEKEKKANEMLDRAYSELGSHARMCYALGISLKGTDAMMVRKLLRNTEERALKNRTRPLGIRAVQTTPGQKEMPLYWKKR